MPSGCARYALIGRDTWVHETPVKSWAFEQLGAVQLRGLYQSGVLCPPVAAVFLRWWKFQNQIICGMADTPGDV